MKIGYLILAHRNPAALSRLIKKLDDRNSAFFVHIDAKVNATPFQAVASEATFITDRVAVHWGGFSMVDATFKLMRAAHATAVDRFVLLSGADYPIKSNEYIRQTLETDFEYIQVDRRLDENGITHFDLCASRLFLGDIPWLNPRSGNRTLIELATRLTKHYRRHIDFPLYYGSSWWALTRAAVEDILHFANDKPKILRALRWTQSPDEIVFQTIVKASSRSAFIAFDAVDGDFQPVDHQAGLHHVDWSRPNPDNPRTLDESDFLSLRDSRALFARKIDQRSAVLLDMLDAQTNR